MQTLRTDECFGNKCKGKITKYAFLVPKTSCAGLVLQRLLDRKHYGKRVHSQFSKRVLGYCVLSNKSIDNATIAPTIQFLQGK